MGAALSCLDPAREHPPFSWPKDHPGRAEAIAEYKARRSAGKFTKKAAKNEGAQPVVAGVKDISEKEIAPVENPDEENAKQVPDSDAIDTAEVKPDVDETEAKDVSVDPSPAVEETTQHTQKEEVTPQDDVIVATQPDEVVEEVVEADTTKVEDPVAALVAAQPASEEDESSAKETVADVTEKGLESPVAEAAPEPPVEVQAPVEVEAPIESGTPGKPEGPGESEAVVEVEAPVEPEASIEQEPPAELEAKLEAESDLAPEPSAEAQTDVQLGVFRASGMRPVSSTIDDRRAFFENKPDALPVVSELSMDIQDPVTGEYVTLAEYRKRQIERAQGVVKEQVDKFEHLDELAMKEKATKKLQIDSRQKKVRSWTKPDSSSTPSSPIEPRKLGELALPEDSSKN